MFRPRIIPVLLLKNLALVKSVQFKSHKYIGDPINAVRIFNELRADELVFLDIQASRNQRTIALDFVRRLGEETSMPFSVGGGIASIPDIKSAIGAGAEKVIICTGAGLAPELIRRASDTFGSSTIVVCIDVKTKFLRGERAWILNGTRSTDLAPLEFARLMEENGAGELIIQSVERDGMMDGYDLELIRKLSAAVTIPVIALGGAGKKEHFIDAYRSGASAVAAGSMFVFHDKNRGVLINYPDKREVSFD